MEKSFFNNGNLNVVRIMKGNINQTINVCHQEKVLEKLSDIEKKIDFIMNVFDINKRWN